MDNVYDAVAATLPDMRRAAESLMTDTFAAYSPTGRTTQDEDTGLEEPTFADEGTTLGKVAGQSRQGGDTQTRMVTIGGVERPVVEGGLHIPLSAPDPAAGLRGQGWEYECTAVGPLSDPQLVGRRYLVVEAPAKSFATARRLDVVEI